MREACTPILKAKCIFAMKQEWMVDDSRRSEEFPTLGQQAASTLSSAWGSGNIKEKLTGRLSA